MIKGYPSSGESGLERVLVQGGGEDDANRSRAVAMRGAKNSTHPGRFLARLAKSPGEDMGSSAKIPRIRETCDSGQIECRQYCESCRVLNYNHSMCFMHLNVLHALPGWSTPQVGLLLFTARRQ